MTTGKSGCHVAKFYSYSGNRFCPYWSHSSDREGFALSSRKARADSSLYAYAQYLLAHYNWLDYTTMTLTSVLIISCLNSCNNCRLLFREPKAQPFWFSNLLGTCLFHVILHLIQSQWRVGQNNDYLFLLSIQCPFSLLQSSNRFMSLFLLFFFDADSLTWMKLMSRRS